MPRALLALFLIATLHATLCPAPARAWGDTGHTEVNRVAAEHIPASMPAFLRTKSAIERIAYLGPEPDRWRGRGEYSLNQAQAPDHFIDLERVAGLGNAGPMDLPHGRYEFIRLLYEKRAAIKIGPDDYLPEKVGLQPYITQEVFDRLKAAFRAYRDLQRAGKPTPAVEQDIVFYAGWLGHYVADGAMPLHTSVYYDGWIGANPRGYTTEKGIHSRFETAFVDRNITAASFAGQVRPPARIADSFRGYLQYLYDSHALVTTVYELDKEGGFDGAGSPQALRFTRGQLAAGAQMLLNLWYTAWLESAE